MIAERALIEVAVTATYLLRSGTSTMEDYRRCSYRNRFKILEQAASGAVYYRSKPGRRLLRSIRNKLALEGLDENSFEQQVANRWRLGGQTFRRIFEDVMLMHPLICRYQITPKISLNTRCSASMLPNFSIKGRLRSSGQLGRW